MSRLDELMIGYLVNRPEGITGLGGLACDYILAGNGLYIQAESRFLRGAVPVMKRRFRGLADLTEPALVLANGRIPCSLFDLALSVMLARPETEVYTAICYDGSGYRLVIPEQTATGTRVEYSNPENVVLDFHSHGLIGPGFSSQDDRDEQGLRLYGVAGDLGDELPAVNFRLGVYGNFLPLRWTDIFEGEPNGFTDTAAPGGGV
jgi:PRTRC genetic system protein A